MTSKPIVQQQVKGDAVGDGGKQQKKNPAADGRSRKALGDIGNVVIVNGVEFNTNRPITRSLGAQILLATNPEAEGNVDNKKKKGCSKVNAQLPAVDGVVAAKRMAPRKAQKKVKVKPKPVEVIDISSSSEEEVEKEKSVQKKKEAATSKKKKPRTLTSTLTARSTAACGHSKMTKESIVDIDATDNENELAAVEYLGDLFMFYKLVEHENRPHDYMDSQPELNEKMRAILADWLIDVHRKFELSPETLYLTINLVDRFLAIKLVRRRELQLLGISAMLVASKYEEIWPPEVNDFVCLSDRAYSPEQILAMEKTILNKLEWYLTVPTTYVFLVRFIKASGSNEKLENMVHFLAELGAMHYDTIMYCPSMVAASAVLAARHILSISPTWSETLKIHTGYSEAQLMDCARLLVSYCSTVVDGKLKSVFKKYCDSSRGAVALVPPASNFMPDGSAD